MLTHKRLKEVFDYNSDYGIFIRKKHTSNCVKIGTYIGNKKNSNQAVSIQIDGAPYKAHILAWFYVYGKWPDKEIDHIDMNQVNNRIINLRLATRSQNEFNKKVRKDNKLGLKGIHFDKNRNKFFVQIKFGEKAIKKRFPDLELAKLFHEEMTENLHGEFGRVA